MEQSKNGGAAFPVQHENGFTQPGMTLRDYFAAKALHSVIAYSHGDVDTSDGSHFAAQAYRFADAMLVERAK